MQTLCELWLSHPMAESWPPGVTTGWYYSGIPALPRKLILSKVIRTGLEVWLFPQMESCSHRLVKTVRSGYLAHVFSSCDAPLAKTPFVVELADEWIKSKDTIRRSCGYGLLYEISKSKKKSAPDEAYFLAHVVDIDKKRKKASIPILMSMAGALLGIGKRTKKLNNEALKVAIAIGPITHSGSCDPFDVAQHLTSDYARQKLGL